MQRGSAGGEVQSPLPERKMQDAFSVTNFIMQVDVLSAG